MSTRYNDRDDEYDRDSQNYGRGYASQYGRSSGEGSRGRYGYGGYGESERERERYSRENAWRGGEYGSRERGRGRDYESSRERYGAGRGWEGGYSGERDRSFTGEGGYSSERRYGNEDRFGNEGRLGSEGVYANEGRYGSQGRYGSRSGQGREGRYSSERQYRGPWSSYSDTYNDPTGFSSLEYYDEGRRGEYERGRSGGDDERGFWQRISDEISSWFGAEGDQRRPSGGSREQYRGRGPKGYRRSDERVKEDVNDRLSDDYYLDASDVEVMVESGEVTLTGTVNSRRDKRRAEDLAESVSGVSNVENRLRVKQLGQDRYSGTETSGTSSSSGTTGTTGTIGSTGASSSAAAGLGRSRTTGS